MSNILLISIRYPIQVRQSYLAQSLQGHCLYSSCSFILLYLPNVTHVVLSDTHTLIPVEIMIVILVT